MLERSVRAERVRSGLSIMIYGVVLQPLGLVSRYSADGSSEVGSGGTE
jgi:hypothetical protein